jgi:hypothetical protein
MEMRSRRFTILAVALVALNLVLWLAPQGLALRQAVIAQLFGPRMIRAEVVVQGTSTTPLDYRLDRGVIVTVSSASLVLREQDGTTQAIAVGAGTRVTGGGRRFPDVASLKRNLRVLVLREANGPATQIQVEGRGLLP